MQRLREALDRCTTPRTVTIDPCGNLEHLLAGLQQERTILEGMRTWPWRPGLFRVFLSAIAPAHPHLADPVRIDSPPDIIR